MSNCSQKYKKMLHAYELGFLSDSARNDLEQHVLECAECFEQLCLFEKEAKLLRDDKEVQQHLIDLHKSTSTKPKPIQTQKILRWAVGIAAVITLLILSPWHIEFIPMQEAVAIENKLMIADFKNMADLEDKDQYGAITANLLITNLSTSKQLQIVSRQRVLDVMIQLGLDNIKSLNDEQVMQVAMFLNVRWLLTGSIITTKPQYELSSQIIELPNGNVFSSQRVMSNEGETIFDLIDRLTGYVSNDLVQSFDATTNLQCNIADITTSSEDAYRFYLNGVENYNRYYYQEALTDFETALSFDSTFAMVYYYLSFIKDRTLIDRAIQFSKNINHKEQMYIKGRGELLDHEIDSAINTLHNILQLYPDEKYAYYQIGYIQYYYQASFDNALVNLHKLIEIDPYFKPAYNLLVYCYTMKDNYEQAIISMDKYLSLDSTSANPLDTKGDLNANFGKLDNAIDSYKRALSIKPNFYSSLYQLGYMYLYQGNFERADSCLQALSQADSKQMKSAARMYLTYLPTRKGQYNKSLSELQNAIRIEQEDTTIARGLEYKYFLKAILQEGLGDIDNALITIDTAITFSLQSRYTENIDFVHYKMHLLILNNETAKVQSVVDSLETIDEYTPKEYFTLWYGKGLLEFEKNNFKQAAEYFLKSVLRAIEKNAYGYYVGRYMAARSYYQGGHLSEAMELFENMKTIYTSRRLFWSVWDNKVPYYLGRIYEDSRWNDKAIEAYSQFLFNLNNADIIIPEISDAKERLIKLQNL